MPEFTHLHVHTEYSLLDGLCKIKPLIDRAKELGQKAIAITDHGNMFGAIDFFKYAKSVGIKPIIGCEVYTALQDRTSRTSGIHGKYSHLILLAENNTGLHNLMKLVSYSYLDGYYYKPRIDYDLLGKYSEGLICLTGCISGDLPKYILDGDIEGAVSLANRLKNIFGRDNLFLEIQEHGLKEEKTVNKGLIEIAQRLDLELAATNDVHYIEKKDSFYQEVLMCIQTQKTIIDPEHIEFGSEEYYLKSAQQMDELFKYAPGAVENTNWIAKRCNVEFEFGKYHLPEFKLPENKTSFGYLTELCEAGIKKRYPDSYEKHLGRMKYELDTIEKMGFSDYFLIVHDFIDYARGKKIPVGPGRGSAAGSIVAYCLGITNIDPIKYGLIFERFLNEERVTMPDIDIDFCYERRQEVIDYVIEKYGVDKVSQIVTFGTLGAKQAVKDVARALALPYSDGDRISKLISFGPKVTLSDALNGVPALKNEYDSDENIRRIIDISLKLEGLPRHCSTHAAGVVITAKPLMEYVPLYKSDDVISTQFTMTALEELGLLKMDFLGLRNLTVINDAVKNIAEDKGIKIDLDSLDYDEEAVYSIFKTGDTDGVFQFEGAGMKVFLKEFLPNSLEDIILCTSFYRPGPMDQIPKLLKNKAEPEKISYVCPELKEILCLTYGCIVYQEQVMEIFRKLAGYTMGRADIVRRAMSKKKMSVLEKEEKLFIEGAAKNNISEAAAKQIFDEILDFAKYAFNKSHAAAYAVVAFQTAYLKYYYKPEFIAALMTSYIERQDKIVKYLKICAQCGIVVNHPDINESMDRFYARDNKIIFGLGAIRNVGNGFVKKIIRERELKGPFLDFEDFAVRMADHELNKRAVESLIKVGAFDEFDNRSDLLDSYEMTIDGILSDIKSNVPGQLNLFVEELSLNEPKAKWERKPLSRNELLMEKEVLGYYLSGHPLDEYKEKIKLTATAYTCDFIRDSEEDEPKYRDGARVTLVGSVTNNKVITTKKNQTMSIFLLEDLYGSVEVLVFPKQFSRVSAMIADERLVTVKGTLMIREDEPVKLCAEEIYLFSTEPLESKLYLRINKKNKDRLGNVKTILKNYSGDSPVYVYFEEKKQNTLADRGLWVSVGEYLISLLKKELGDENVVVK